jgi:hypothetical protein
MNYIIGNAVEIFSEVPSAKVTGTTLSLYSLKGEDGIELAASEALTFDATITNLASVVWQSVRGTHQVGKYIYIIKSLNGINENYAKGSFYLTE